MAKKIVKLTESQLHDIIAESVENILASPNSSENLRQSFDAAFQKLRTDINQGLSKIDEISKNATGDIALQNRCKMVINSIMNDDLLRNFRMINNNDWNHTFDDFM